MPQALRITLKRGRRFWEWRVWQGSEIVGMSFLPRRSEASARRRAESVAARVLRADLAGKGYRKVEYPYVARKP